MMPHERAWEGHATYADPNRCESCGELMRPGDWPFCPHGQPGKFSIVPDEVPGGFMVENGFNEPRKFYSHSEHRAALAADGLEIRAKWAGPGDKIMTNWAAGIDAGTMDNARTLLGRAEEARAAKRRMTAPVTVTDAGTFTRQDVEPA
jgi:hypothetical protein